MLCLTIIASNATQVFLSQVITVKRMMTRDGASSLKHEYLSIDSFEFCVNFHSRKDWRIKFALTLNIHIFSLRFYHSISANSCFLVHHICRSTSVLNQTYKTNKHHCGNIRFATPAIK